MKKLVVKELNDLGIKIVGGKKLCHIGFYELCGILKRAKNGEKIK